MSDQQSTATTYEQRIVEKLREIADDSRPRRMHYRLQYPLGPRADFESAEMGDAYADLMRSVERLIVRSWRRQDDEDRTELDKQLAYEIRETLWRLALAVHVGTTPHGDDPVILHPILEPSPPGEYGWQDDEEPELLVP